GLPLGSYFPSLPCRNVEVALMLRPSCGLASPPSRSSATPGSADRTQTSERTVVRQTALVTCRCEGLFRDRGDADMGSPPLVCCVVASLSHDERTSGSSNDTEFEGL